MRVIKHHFGMFEGYSFANQGAIFPHHSAQAVIDWDPNADAVEVVARFRSRRTASKLGMRKCGKINGLNSSSETWTGTGMVTDFCADVGMI
jgi:hypothetical protein